LNAAVAWEVLLLGAIIYVPFLQRLFSTFPFAWTDIALTTGVAFSVVPVLELVKWIQTSEA
jgi:Ca2+-transporting ATPase